MSCSTTSSTPRPDASLLRWAVVTLIGTSGLLAACTRLENVACEQSDECNLTAGGICSLAPSGNRWCSYPNSACESGYAYSTQAVGDDLSGACVVVGDQGGPGDAGVTCEPRVVFVDGSETMGSGRREVWVANTDGAGLLNLSKNTAADDAYPSWAPNGQKIAFVSNRSGRYDVFVINSDGSQLTNLTASLDMPLGARLPTWAPDGLRIAFVNGYDLWLMNPDGTRALPVPIQRNVSGDYLAWSPDSKQIVFESNTDGVPNLYVANVDNGSPAYKLNAGSSSEGGATWAPHPKITFDDSQDVYSVGGDGTGRVNITQTPTGSNRDAQLTSKGDTVVFSSRRDNGYVELWKSASIGGVATQLTHNTIKNAGDHAEDISPDGRFVAFLRTTAVVDGTSQVGVIGIDGDDLKLFNSPGQSNAAHARFSPCQ